MQRVLIRVDANPEIALGHLKRCISLAEGLSMKGIEPIFLAFDGKSSRNLLSKYSFQSSFINTPVNTGNDSSKTLGFMKTHDINSVIIDSYSANKNYLDVITKEGYKVICLDDLADRSLPCDIIINGSIGAEELDYEAPLKLLGIKYCILGKHFWNYSDTRSSSDINNIMITMGGIDHYRLSERCMKIIDKIPGNISITVIVGPFYDNKSEIERVARQISKYVELVEDKDNLHPYMQKCDMAISAGGFTLYELVTLKKPTLGICLWENQYRNVIELDKRNVISGLKYTNDPSFDKELSATITRLAGDIDIRTRMAENTGDLFDGQGALRIAAEIKNFIELDDIRET
ncbi:MAG: UDP-2,4-diacetamido-2,4,6-trideoxy-beta-L-altropyranose hydrolase [Candidatus Scalindua sp.]